MTVPRTKESGVRIAPVAKLLYDDAGVDDIDPRLSYVVIQVSRNVWEEFSREVERTYPE